MAAVTTAAVVGGAGIMESRKARKSGERAARVQTEGGNKSIDYMRESELRQIERLQPFTGLFTPELQGQLTQAATGQLPPVGTGVEAFQAQQMQPVNPLLDPSFKALADEASNRVFANQAARGKLGSGGTAAALQERLVGLGEGIRGQRLQEQLATRGQYAGEQQQQFGQQLQLQGLAQAPEQEQYNRLLNLANLSQSSAAGQAAAIGQTGRGVADLTTQIANAQAAGQVGAAQARSNQMSGLMGLGGQLGAAYLMRQRPITPNLPVSPQMTNFGPLQAIA